MTVEPTQELHINPEYQDLIQPLTKEEYELLKKSIQEQGQHIPIIVNTKGTVIDGHHRYTACQELGIIPKVQFRAFVTPLDEKLCIIDCNLKRRHLTDAQKVEIGHRIKPVYQELAKRNESMGGKGVPPDTPLGRVDDVVAKEVGLSTRTFQRGEIILTQYPEVFEKDVKKAGMKIGKVHNRIKIQQKKEGLREAARNTETTTIPEGCQLIFGDFIEKSNEISDNSVDLVFTDPPYDKSSIHLYGEVAKVGQRVLKPGGSFLALAGHYYVPEYLNIINAAGLKYNDIICVKYPVGHELLPQSNVFNDWKPLLWYKKGDKLREGFQYISNFTESGHPNKDLHAWQQSQDEVEYVISKLTFEKQTVFDPMMGAGTTGVVALRLNRQFIGIEQNEETFNIAKGNIAKENKN